MQEKKKEAMTQPNKSGLRGCLTSRALRIVLFLLAILLLGGVFVYLLNDDDRGPVSPEMMDEAATGGISRSMTRSTCLATIFGAT